MSRSQPFARRELLRRAAVLAAGVAGASFLNLRPADAEPSTVAWELDPSWGYPLGAHGRTSCHCRACIAHAANKVFATSAAATAGRAHVGCLCQPKAIVIPLRVYQVLFTYAGATSVDRRDPTVAAELGSPPPAGPRAELPIITSFGPIAGRAGDAVSITGMHLAGTTEVTFGERRARSFHVDSDTQITTFVPSGAGTGRVSVNVPSRGRGVSAASFVVDHDRAVTLKPVQAGVAGSVTVADGFGGCGSHVPIKLQRHSDGMWKTVARGRTDAGGSYQFDVVNRAGTYRAIARQITVASGDVAMRAVSGILTREDAVNGPVKRLTPLVSPVH